MVTRHAGTERESSPRSAGPQGMAKLNEQQRQIDSALARGRSLHVWIVRHAHGAESAVAATESGALRVFQAAHPGLPAIAISRAHVRDVESAALAAYYRAA